MNTEKPEASPSPSPAPAAPPVAKMGRYYLFFGVVIVLAVAAGIANTVMGAAGTHDRNAESDIEALSNAVNNYDQQHFGLPEDLSQVTKKTGNGDKVDAITEQGINLPLSEYDYKTTGRFTYRICATFKTSTLNSTAAKQTDTPNGQIHGIGHVCFDFTDDNAKSDSQFNAPAPSPSPPLPPKSPSPSPSAKPTVTPIPAGSSKS